MKKNYPKLIILTIITIIITCFCILDFNPLFNKISKGLDLQGGFEVLYEVNPIDKDGKVTSDMVYQTYKTILKRIDVLGVSEPEITIEGENHIRVRLAGITNEDDARNILSKTASLTFRDTNDNLLMTSKVLKSGVKVTMDQTGRPAVALPIKDVETFYAVTDKVKDMINNQIVIWLDFDETEDAYYKEKDKCGSLGNSKCLSAATVNQAFASDVIIQGNFTEEEAKNLVDLINSGAMPTKLNEISSRTVEATYGGNSLNKTMNAAYIGVALVFILIIIIYRFSGFISSVTLLIYTYLSFLIFYLINGVLTLPGIAAMILGVGMAVDSSVISYERIKEQLKMGKSLKEAFKLGSKESLSSIIDANITTIIVAIILFIFGESSIKGFATMLIINIIVTILIMVFLNKSILSLFVNTNYFNDKLNLFIGMTEKKKNKTRKKFDFVKKRKYILLGTLSIITIGLAVGIFKGMNLGVDFSGGSDITISSNIKIDDIKNYLNKNKYTISKIEKYEDKTDILINEVLSKEESNQLKEYFKNEYNIDTTIYTVSNVVKKELIKNGIYSLIIASIGMIIYVSLRFKFNYAISGIIALVHDVLITLMFFIVFNLEINSMFIASILTIIGYSINDTIVTFDRIRSNYNKGKINKKNIHELEKIVNKSVNETLFRSILTTVTTIIPVIILIICGSSEIINLNIAMLVGFIAGVYSSLFISNELWLIFETKSILKEPKKKKQYDEIDELNIKGINS